MIMAMKCPAETTILDPAQYEPLLTLGASLLSLMFDLIPKQMVRRSQCLQGLTICSSWLPQVFPKRRRTFQKWQFFCPWIIPSLELIT